jgi:hypothetical protein
MMPSKQVLPRLCFLACLLAACAGAPSQSPEPTHDTPATSTARPPTTTPSQPPEPSPTAPDPIPTLAPQGFSVSFESTYGGPAPDRGIHIHQTRDDGYAVTGYTENTADESEDLLLVRLDPNGEVLWSRTYGGAGTDNGWSVTETEDGGFAVAGFTDSQGAGGMDVWLLRTDSEGNLLWDRTFGGEWADYGWSIHATPDGGFIIAGQTDSFEALSTDAYLVRTDENGELLWSRFYGGPGIDRVFSVDLTEGGGYIVGGITDGAGGRDAYLFLTDETGEPLWERAFGGENADVGHTVEQTADGGFIVYGYTESFGAQREDVYLVKTDIDGEVEWERVFGESGDDRILTGAQTPDGGFVLVGFTQSETAGGLDVLIILTDPEGNLVWRETLGGEFNDRGYTIIATDAGDFALVGDTRSYGEGAGDVYIIGGAFPEIP